MRAEQDISSARPLVWFHARADTRSRRIWQGIGSAVKVPRLEVALMPSAKGLSQRERGRIRSLSTGWASNGSSRLADAARRGVYAAMAWYSWSSPPRRSRRPIWLGGGRSAGGGLASGGRCSSERCGRCRCEG
jgi:hypothetical protein